MLTRIPSANNQPRLVNPAPGGDLGRTDQGGDWSNIRGNIGAVGGGVISAIYRGLSGFGTLVVEKLSGSNEQIYYGLETGGGDPVVRQGQRVRAGQAIAPGLGRGGIEVGIWNPRTGHAAGFQPGVTSGGATSAGEQFKQQIFGSSSLEQLWIDNGGPPGVARIMAAIALAESGGRLDATHKNSNGTTDYGPWQVNSSHSQFNPSLLVSDPNYTAKAAVAVYRSQGLSAWTTYKTGAYRSYMQQAPTATLAGSPGITRPGGQSAGSGSSGGGGNVQQVLQDYVSLRDTPRTAPPSSKNPASWWWASFTGNWQKINSDSGGI